MAKARKKGRKKQKAQEANAQKFGILLLLVSLLSFSALGFLGKLSANLYRFFVGDFYLPASIIGTGIGLYMLVRKRGISLKNKKTGGIIIGTVGILLFLHAQLFGPIINPELNPLLATWRFFVSDIRQNSVVTSLGGGMIGAALYALTHFLVSQVGTYILAVLLILWGLVWIFSLPVDDLWEFTKTQVKNAWQWLQGTIAEVRKKRSTAKKQKKQTKKSKKDKQPKQTQIVSSSEAMSGANPSANESAQVSSSGDYSDTHTQPALTIDAFQENQNQETAPEEGDVPPADDGEALDFEITAEAENEDYKLPPISLLDKRKVVDQSNEYSVIQENVQKLEDTFESFGVDATVTKANLGPAVTKYEIRPATGVKVSKIVNLSDDIALSLAAKDIRMEAPIPGKALIGIEVPNQEVSTVSFRDVIEGQDRHPERLLEVPLGRDISGSIAMADLSKMPHLLVAGATGSGKSVSINTIITSLLMKAKPNEVKMMMIDPKMVELNMYNGIPHLLTPVVTNPRKAAQALQKVVQEMERRYELFAESGTRNITGYNEFVKETNKQKEEALNTLPFIVVIVDELADLMMVASNDVEDAIIRLAQMARAAGIHMILATQRPSVDVITGIIKANVPSRIAFAVSSGTDSRTILDSNGAEKLLGRGDMLFQPMGQNKPTRVQGAFISDEEVEAVVSFVKNQQEANYVEEMIPDDEPATNTSEAEDELFDDAVDLVVDMQTASISMLQRRFRIGYNRAARLIDEMELRGIVGPHEGSKPRVVNMQKPNGEDANSEHS